MRRGMDNLRLDGPGPGLDWVDGHGTVALRLLIRFWGTRSMETPPTKGGTERRATVLSLRLAGCGTWPIWGHFHEPSARRARTATRAASPFGAVTPSRV